MKLLTKEIKRTMPGPRAQEDVEDPIAHVKFFSPVGRGTWYATEAWQVILQADGEYREAPLSEALKDGETLEDIHFFGLVDLGFEPELGNWSFNELKSVRLAFGLGIERDLHFKPTKLSKIRTLVRS
jgi:hypothetical protein